MERRDWDLIGSPEAELKPKERFNKFRKLREIQLVALLPGAKSSSREGHNVAMGEPKYSNKEKKQQTRDLSSEDRLREIGWSKRQLITEGSGHNVATCNSKYSDREIGGVHNLLLLSRPTVIHP